MTGEQTAVVRCNGRDTIFFHVNKTGGTAILHGLGLLDTGLHHHTVREVKNRVSSEVWGRAFKFSIVRNPWDKVVSHYSYRVDTNQTRMREEPIGFEDWVRATYGRERSRRYFDIPEMFMAQCDWLKNAEGELEVDYIGRFEALQDAFDEICRELGAPGCTLPRVKASDRQSRDYRHYYSDDTADMIANAFAEDITRFGYAFDG